jgi:ABC-type glycerol-3-phosphate transport system substrate-binding protein
MTTKRPIALAVASVLIGGAALTGCTAPEPEITLELLTWHGPESSTTYYEGYEQIINEYRAQHPEIAIEIKYEEDATFGSILETGFAGGTAPDIIQMKSAQRTTFGTELLDLREYLVGPSPYADGDVTWIDTFVGGEGAFPVEDNGVNANSILFVPNDGNPEVFAGKLYIYNKAIVSDAGLDPDAPPVDWKDMFEWLEALSGDPEVAPIAGSSDVGGKVSQIGYGFGAEYADEFFADEFNDPEFANDLFTDKIYVLTNYDRGSAMPLADLPYYPAMFALMKQHLSYYQESWPENSPETEILTFASGKSALMNTSFWDYSTLVGSLNEATFPEGYGLFQVPYFGDETLDYAADEGWISDEEAEAAAPYAVDRTANAAGAGRHEYGFTVNKAVAEDEERLAATIDFLQFLSSKDVQTKYVETASSLSPVAGVEIVESMQPFVVEEPEGGFAERVLGYSVVEWGLAGWDVHVTAFLRDEITWEEMIANVAGPEWAADIPPVAALDEAVAAAQAEVDAAAEDTKEEKERALKYNQLRAGLYKDYYWNMSGDLVPQG